MKKFIPALTLIVLSLLSLATSARAQQENKITLSTSTPLGEYIELKIVADGDLYQVEGAETSSYAGSDRIRYKVLSPTISIKGAIKRLDCNNNAIESIDASQCTSLQTLMAGKCQLKDLKLASKNKVSMLSVNDNALTSIVLTDCPELKSLYAQNNQLTELDLTGASKKLTTLMTYGNNLQGEAMKSFLESLPNRKDTYSASLYGIDTKLASEKNVITKDEVAEALSRGWEIWDVNGGSYTKYEGSDPIDDIATITMETELPVGEKIELVILTVNNEPIEIEGAVGDFESGTPIKYLIQSPQIVLKGKIEELNCRMNSGIRSITFLRAKNLKKITCHENKLEQLDLQGCPVLEELLVSKNKIKSLQLSNNSTLKQLTCNENLLTELDLSNQSQLSSIIASGNPLTAINLKNCTSLRELVVNNCSLTTLDLSDCSILYRLITYCNRIKSKGMKDLVTSLNENPDEQREKVFYAIDKTREEEVNSITKAEVKRAVEKGWKVYNYNFFDPQPYEGDEEDWVELEFPAEELKEISLEAKGENVQFEGASIINNEGDNYQIKVEKAKVKILGSLHTLKVNATNLESVTILSRDLEVLDLSDNKLTAVEIKEAPDLRIFLLHQNRLKSLNLPTLALLEKLTIYSNSIQDKKMNELFSQLSDRTGLIRGEIYVIDTKSPQEANVATTLSIETISKKNWLAYDYNEGTSVVYEGSTPRIGDGRIECTSSLSIGTKIRIELEAIGAYKIEGLKGEIDDNGIGIMELTSSTIKFSGDLRKLYLQDAGLTHFSHSQCNQLEELSLVMNSLTEISLEGLPQLHYLSLYNNLLTGLDLSSCKSIREAFAFGNNLSYVTIDGCTELQKLWLNDNQILSFKAIDLTSLEECSIDNNQLQSAEIENCPHLKQLRLAKNQLSTVSIKGVPQLRQCYLHSNALTTDTMGELATTLPLLDQEGGFITVIDTDDLDEKNKIFRKTVSAMKEKNWRVYNYRSGNLEPFVGTANEVIASRDQVELSWLNKGTLLLSTPEQMVGATYVIYLMSGELVVAGKIHSTRQVVSIPGEGTNASLSYIVQIGTYSSVITNF